MNRTLIVYTPSNTILINADNTESFPIFDDMETLRTWAFEAAVKVEKRPFPHDEPSDSGIFGDY